MKSTTMTSKNTTFLRDAFLIIALFILGGNAVYAQNTTPFVTTWEVAESSRGITIPTNNAFAYGYTVNWGDGNTDTTTYTGDAEHTYSTAGIYTVSISGTFPSIYFNSGPGSSRLINSRKIKTIKQWGDNPWKSMHSAFQGCTNLTLEATAGNPDLSKVTDMSRMFAHTDAFNQDINEWDVSNVTDMAFMFAHTDAFNQDLSGWDVGNVTDMSGMFTGADAFNLPLGGWEVSNVTNMLAMFNDATAFNQDIGGWDVSNVTNMQSMFGFATAFNQALGGWEVSNVTDMRWMFSYATAFNQALGGWDVSNVTDMQSMFTGATLSTANYEALLRGWSALPSLQMYVRFSGGNSNYCDESARNILVNTHNWSIIDGGKDTDLDCTKAHQATFAFASASITRNFGDAAFTIIPTGGSGTGGVTYLSTDTSVATIDANSGEVALVGGGTTTITATKAGDVDYNPATASYTLTIIDYANAFVTTWEVAAGSLGITIPTHPGNVFAYSYTVDWGDSSADTRVYTGNAGHTYTTAGTYTVRIAGTFPSIYFNTDSSSFTNSRKIKTIKQWGSNPWESMNSAFEGCRNLTIEATAGNPDLSNVTDMSFMFAATAFNQDIRGWDVSNVTNMRGMFWNAGAFNQHLNDWDVSNVTDMSHMFQQATAFDSLISRWDVSNVGTMQNMFGGATAFDRVIDYWDVSNVTNMRGMFWEAHAFNRDIGRDIGGWDVSNVTDMSLMFLGAHAFNRDIGGWDVSNVTDMSGMFEDATAFNQDLSGWDVSNVTNMRGMFGYATAFNRALGGWDVSNVTDMNYMFLGATLSTADYDALLRGWSALPSLQPNVTFHAGNSNYCAQTARNILVNTPHSWSITDGGKHLDANCPIEQAVFAFASASLNKSVRDAAFTYLPTGGSGTGGITYLSTNPSVATINPTTREAAIIGIGTTTITATKAGDATYYPATASYTLTIIDYGDAFVTTWGVVGSRVITIPTNNAFAYSYTVDWGDSSADTTIYTGNASHTYPAFGTYTVSIAGTFPSIYFNDIGDKTKIHTIKQWGSNPWESMERAFRGCVNLTIESTAGNPDLSNVTNMRAMFRDATVFNSDIGGWDVRNVTNMHSMFRDATAFNQALGGWGVNNVTTMGGMFSGADAFNQDIGGWDVSNVTDMDEMFLGATLSTENYDALLTGWSALPSLQPNVPFHAGSSNYCDENARNILVNTPHSWRITDGGKDLDLDCTKAYQATFAFASASLTKSVIDAAFTYPPTGGASTGGLTYLSTDPSVATIDPTTGEVAITGIGTTTITATKAGDAAYHPPPATASYTLTIDYGNAFVTTWEVAAGSLGITIPTNGDFTYSYTVDWGDGTDTTTHTGDASHTYTAAGIYTVSIAGTFPSIYFNYSGDRRKINTIKQWGDNPWKSMNLAFYGCENLTIEATAGNPDLSNVTDMSLMFAGADAFNQALGGWDVSNVTDMSFMFAFATAFNQVLSGWDVSNVTNMSAMFYFATAFNQALGGWDVSNVTNMSEMFRVADAFNQDIGGWDVSNVTDMERMFYGATAFNQDLGGWDVSNVTDMSAMFSGADAFNQDLGGWDVSNVTDMGSMFSGADAFNQPLNGWGGKTSNVTHMGSMFSGADAFNQPLSGWDVSNVTNMRYMFSGADAFNQVLSGWDVSNVTNMRYMFNRADAFNQPLGGWDVSNVTNMSHMFDGATAFNQVLSGWDVSNVTIMYAMFANSAFNQPLSGWDVSNVTTMSHMFNGADCF